MEHLIVGEVKNISSPQLVQQSGNPTRKQVWMRTRNFVKKSKFNSSGSILNNPFIKGDKLAEKCQLEKLPAIKSDDHINDNPSSPKIKIEIKADIPSKDEVENDMEWNASEIGNQDDFKPPVNKVVKRKRKRQKNKPTDERRVVVNGKMKCNYCDKDFFNKLTCYKHEQDEHSSETSGHFICDICGKTFGTQTKLQHHKYHVHKLKFDGTPRFLKSTEKSSDDDDGDFIRPTCKICLKTFSTEKILLNHVKIIHERKLLYSCQLCGKGLRGSVHMKTHMLQVHKEDPLTKQLEEEGIRLWRCEQIGCSAIFLKESSLDSHYKNGNHRNSTVKSFICEICGKSFTRRYSYDEHKQLVHKMKEGN